MAEQSEPLSPPKLIVGLGNPGAKYELTRHNMGYLFVQHLAHSWGWSFKEKKKLFGKLAHGISFGHKVYLFLPTTYMNESGRAVQEIMHEYRIQPQEILVVTDDSALSFGRMRLKPKGGTGGHNGLKSIQESLQTQSYPRLRLGVNEPLGQQDLSDHVLGRLSSQEQKTLPQIISKAGQVVEQLIQEEPLEQLMNWANTTEPLSEKMKESTGEFKE